MQGLIPFRLALQAGLVAALAFAFYFLVIALWNPILDSFGFRQAQTGITAYWFNQGGAWLAYETPVLGSPWAIPFEFPLYQMMVALLSQTGLPITVSGRLISYAFYIATLLPAYSLARTYKVGTDAFLIFAILYLLSPLYMFWGRSVMVETAAVFFAAVWLAAFAKFLEEGARGAFAVALVAGSLAMLIKSTTLLAFLFLGGYMSLIEIYKHGVRASLDERRTVALGVVAMAGALFAVGYAWILYTDAVKVLNPVGPKLTSSALTNWVFGSIEQRTSLKLWKNVIVDRVLRETFGYAVTAALITCAAAFLDRRSLTVMLLGIAAFLVSILTFTNLHLIHNYYQVASAIFLIGAVAAGVQGMSAKSEWMAAVLLVLIAGGQLVYTTKISLPRIERPAETEPRLVIGEAIAKTTTPQDTILVFGTDWSSRDSLLCRAPRARDAGVDGPEPRTQRSAKAGRISGRPGAVSARGLLPGKHRRSSRARQALRWEGAAYAGLRRLQAVRPRPNTGDGSNQRKPIAASIRPITAATVEDPILVEKKACQNWARDTDNVADCLRVPREIYGGKREPHKADAHHPNLYKCGQIDHRKFGELLGVPRAPVQEYEFPVEYERDREGDGKRQRDGDLVDHELTEQQARENVYATRRLGPPRQNSGTAGPSYGFFLATTRNCLPMNRHARGTAR